ncbi:MAG TPA: LLM class flavin-dependent oxidoreductase [Solirubrobacteraceae bacterium]|jgi:alkanesulfonate monooxygenase SsuD/methylene tetrahydromethanopterin reductase-like flavin-dependent oxidoreductase (luciferase family)|nr:LLM class flavin-dependent oxidoreductase [Solirubrobacteraceae bacterium]
MSADVAIGLWYDLRNPAQWRRPYEDLYAATVEQIVLAEQLGLDSVWLTEHHFCDDGYTPSPLVVLGGVATRTERLRLGTNLMLPALHNPVRLAEDAATVAILSRGRFDLGVAVGYREIEFEAFGRSVRQRPSLLEESVDIMRRAWAGESIQTHGKRFQFPDLRVGPVPEHAPGLLIGGLTEPAIERAARIADGFLSTQNDHQPVYLQALERLGRDPAEGRIFAGQWAIVAPDPERTWAQIGQHALYQLNEYIGWGAFGPPDQVPRFESPEQIVQAGAYQLWDAELAVKELNALLTGCPQVRDVHFWGQLPGESVDSGSERVEYLAREVAPRVRAAAGA